MAGTVDGTVGQGWREEEKGRGGGGRRGGEGEGYSVVPWTVLPIALPLTCPCFFLLPAVWW